MKTSYSFSDKFELQISISRVDIGASTSNVRQDTKNGVSGQEALIWEMLLPADPPPIAITRCMITKW